jgi:hypothetical protein
MAKRKQREHFSHATRSLARHTAKMGNTIVLITHFAAKIMLTALFNQGCERLSWGLECNIIADVAECIQ